MASTPSQNNAFELMTTGEKSGQWGDITNVNMQIIDRATKGVGAISLTGSGDEITTVDYTLSDGHYAVLVFSGTAGTVTINPNDQQKVFMVKNTTAGTVTITQGSGGNVALAAGASAIIYADGAGSGAQVVDVTANFSIDLTTNALTGTTAEFNAALSDGSFATLAGTETLTNKTINSPTINSATLTSPTSSSPTFTGAVYANGSYRGNITAVAALDIDCSTGNYFVKSINSNSTFTFSNPPASRAYGFMLKLNITGAPTITWPASVLWPANLEPTWSSGAVNLYVFMTDDGGTTWRGSAVTDYTG